ncbi:MAG: arylesterase [Alphaproteobacteria bacterium]
MRVLAIGDSLTAGWGVPDAAGFTVRLERALRAEGRPVEIINAGVPGETTAGGRQRLDWLMREPFDAAMVELGANDALMGVPPERVFANLDAILDRLETRGVPILLAGMLAPPDFGDRYEEAFNDAYVRLTRKHDVVFYPFFLDGVTTDPALHQGDGIHPNARGVDVIVERILPDVRRLLDRVVMVEAP